MTALFTHDRNPRFYSETDSNSLIGGVGSYQKRRNDPSAFTRQKIESTASRLRIHGFNADSPRVQVLKMTGMRKSDALSTAKNDEFRLQVHEGIKVFRRKRIKARAQPRRAAGLGIDK